MKYTVSIHECADGGDFPHNYRAATIRVDA